MAVNELHSRHDELRRSSSDFDLDLSDFVDAVEPTMNLEESLLDCQVALQRFFSNDLEGAIRIMTPWKGKSLYHSHGAAIFEFIPAMLTMDPQQIETALAAVKETLEVCHNQRRCYSFIETIIKKHDYGGHSAVQAHAQLVHAEALLVQACLIALTGEELAGLMRATLRIKNAHGSYKQCLKILEKKTSWEHPETRDHFESGVRMGVATFNVMISMLPPKLIALLEFVGFSADKEYGLEELLVGARKPGLRSVLCSMTLLIQHLIIGQFAATTPDLALCQSLIKENLAKYPGSMWFLMFKGRLEVLCGEPCQAISTYNEASDIEGLWPQLRHLAFWECMWANAMIGRWEMCATYASRLLAESKWSRTVYSYAILAACIQRGIPPDDPRIQQLIRSANDSKQRIMGRSVPVEKFALRRCERLQSRGYLVLPATEMLCLWNMFPAISKEQKTANRVLKDIEDEYNKAEKMFEDRAHCQSGSATAANSTDPKLKYDADDFNLLRHMRGVMLLCMGFPRLALKYLESIINDKEPIKDTHLVAYTLVEVAMCYYSLGDTDLALRCLYDARKKSGYSLESRLQFRIHAKTEMIRQEMRARSTASAPVNLRPPVALGTDDERFTNAKSIYEEPDKGGKKDKKHKKKIQNV